MASLYLIGNWKLNGHRAAAADFARQWSLDPDARLELSIAPPFPYLESVAKALPQFALAAQDCSVHERGAHTGEVSAGMLADLGCRYVLVGHSERRQAHGETDAQVGCKLKSVQAAGLIPVLCVGEQQWSREAGSQDAVVCAQLRGSLQDVDPNALVVAYEPIWAIGTGLTATPEQANAMHGVIRAEIGRLMGKEARVPLLYGGSVTPDTARSLFDCPNVDGALVGGASLEAGSFAAIAQSALDSLAN